MKELLCFQKFYRTTKHTHSACAVDFQFNSCLARASKERRRGRAARGPLVSRPPAASRKVVAPRSLGLQPRPWAVAARLSLSSCAYFYWIHIEIYNILHEIGIIQCLFPAVYRCRCTYICVPFKGRKRIHVGVNIIFEEQWKEHDIPRFILLAFKQ
jgi:hypothetical protein